jgi:hypothetical protein
MSAIIDLLAVSQEEAIMRNLAERMGVDFELIHPKYFTFTYNQLDDVRVAIQIRARAQTVNGEKSPWQADRTVQFHRAKLRGLASQRMLNVNWVSGMAIEHILRALKLTHSFNVSASELEFQQADGSWIQLAESYRPVVKTLYCRFAASQGRFLPSSSQFTVVLSDTQRNDLGEYLRIISAGTVTGALQ